MTAYIAQIGAFLAALVAIGEPTWDSSKKGLNKLRPMGYVAAFLALVSFIASIYITMENNETEQHKKTQRQVIQTIGNTEICVSISKIKLLIDVLSNMGAGERNFVGAKLRIPFTDLVSNKNLDKLETIDLSKTISVETKIGDTRPLSQYLSEEMKDSINDINTTISKYGFYLERNTMYLAGLVTIDNYTRKIIRLDNKKKYINSNYTNSPYFAINPGERDDFVEFVGLLNELTVKVGGSYEMVCQKPSGNLEKITTRKGY